MPKPGDFLSFSVGRVNIGGEKVIIWDLGGQIGLRAIWEKYYGDAHGLIFVVDASDPLPCLDQSKATLGSALTQLKRHDDKSTD